MTPPPTAKAARPRPQAKLKPRAKPKRRRKPASNVYGVAPLITDEDTLAASAQALQTLDPDVIGHIVEVGGPPPLRLREPGFAGLAAIVISQQVSVASANAIRARLEAALHPLEAARLAAASDETLRACGLSGGKMRTLRAVAGALQSGALDLGALAAMPAADAHAALVAVHGIGPWTADIFLLFCLGHSDAWPAGDIALQEAARIALKLRARPDATRLTKIAERWRPYRGVAARMLWAYYHVARQRRGIVLV